MVSFVKIFFKRLSQPKPTLAVFSPLSRVWFLLIFRRSPIQRPGQLLLPAVLGHHPAGGAGDAGPLVIVQLVPAHKRFSVRII